MGLPEIPWWVRGEKKEGRHFKVSARHYSDKPQTTLETSQAGPRDREAGQPEIISTNDT